MLDGISNFGWKMVENLVNCQQLLFIGIEWHSKFGSSLCKKPLRKTQVSLYEKYSPISALQLPYSKIGGVLFKLLEKFAFQ
jgi:hypothetical protein